MSEILDKQFIAYDQAIKAYQFQVTRYNTWMNYYALFVGALFVAFYMIICYSQNINIVDTKHLLILMSVLGIVASTCWMASLIGNCAWMKNYIKAVKKNEEAFFGVNNANLIVYRSLITEDTEWCKWWKSFINRIKKEKESWPDWTKKILKACFGGIKKLLKACFNFIIGNRRPEFISTQKMTQWFVGAVLAAWIYIFICLCREKEPCIIDKVRDYEIMTSIGVAFGIWLIFKIFPLFLWADNLKGMK
ncbi:MAG: hypothetical protein K2I97_03655 [Alistipes sp.]|nr:hypothetical protein [Alistipes sp.]